MTAHCPRCGQPLQDKSDPVEQLREWCVRNGHQLWPLDTISKNTIAILVERSARTVSVAGSTGAILNSGGCVFVYLHPLSV